MSDNYQELKASVLRRANELKDRNLIVAALRGLERDGRLAALLQPSFDPMQNDPNVPLQVASQHDFMCPDLYRATVSGSINRVNSLLGLTETTRIHDGADDVTVSVHDNSQRNGSSRQWGCRLHGDSLCTVQEVTAEKNTVLHIAAEQGHVELVQKIVRKDSTLLISRNSRHETPVHLAARAGNCRIVSHIGANEVLTKRSIEGDTVLHEATRHGHRDVVEVLMTVAPALSAEENNASMSPLYIAVVRNSVGIVQALLQYPHSSAVGPNKQNALHAAVVQSQEITSMLLDWKAEMANERDSSGSTPMHYAASSGSVTAVQKFLDKVPLSVYIQDEEGWSPLHVAAQLGHYSSLRHMINHCPDSFERHDNKGRNFLHYVEKPGGKLKFLYYISRRPDLKKIVNERDNEGNTPMHCASMNGYSGTIWSLLRACKADITQMNNAGKTALDHAVSISSFFFMAGTLATLSANGAKFSPQRRDKMKEWKDETNKWIDRTSNNLIVVSVLIATIAFTAAFNVPGSFNGNGLANLRQKKQYHIFLILDTTAMASSVSTTFMVVLTKAVHKRGSWNGFLNSLFLLWVSLFTMELAFLVAIPLVLGSGKYATRYIVFFVSTILFMLPITYIVIQIFPADPITMIKFLFTIKNNQRQHQILLIICERWPSILGD